MKIKQIKKEEVLETICKGEPVFRLDTDKVETKNLKNMSINRIVEGFSKDSYVYFILEVSE